MSDYCDCCATNVEHIRQHYDPWGYTQATDKAEIVLASFTACFPDETPLTLRDVQDYLDSLQREKALQ